MAGPEKANERFEKLKKVMLEMQLPFKQIGGQRIFGPPKNYEGHRPEKGCEVYVTNLPREMWEDEILELFAQAGPLYMVKIMMDFSGTIRGFAYITYVDRTSAVRAITMFHDYTVPNGKKKLACYVSLDNSKLYFEGMPIHLSVEKAVSIFKELFEHYEVTVFPDPVNAGRNLGVGFIEFFSHRSATVYRKLLWPAKIAILGSELFVDWAVPLPDFDEVS